MHWKDWCWSWNSDTLATWCKELTHLKRPWLWERLKVGGERDDRGWDGWMASPTRWTWVWVSSRHWWWTGKPGVLQSMGSQRVRHDWVTELNWTTSVPIHSSTFTESSFRIWNSSTGIPSPPLTLFVVMLSKAHLTSHSRMSRMSRMSGSRWMITPSWLSWLWRSICTVLCTLATSS